MLSKQSRTPGAVFCALLGVPFRENRFVKKIIFLLRCVFTTDFSTFVNNMGVGRLVLEKSVYCPGGHTFLLRKRYWRFVLDD